MEPTTKVLQLILTDTSASNLLIRVTEDTANETAMAWSSDDPPAILDIDGSDGESVVIDSAYVAGVSIRNDDLQE
jgi:hypothetical protein